MPTADGAVYASSSLGWPNNWHTEYANAENPLQLRFQTYADGSATASVVENEGRQRRSWRFVPEANGVRLWMSLKTEESLPGGFILPQCLRLGAGLGYDSRRTVATVPFLSEFLMQALGNPNGTLTWVRRQGSWSAMPVPFTRYHTQSGAGIYADSAGSIDCALIVRETASREEAPASYWQAVAPNASWKTWCAGLYWERATFVSNRHPADCLHVGVDFGPLQAGETRTVHGKFYWLEGNKELLFDAWQTEFGS